MFTAAEKKYLALTLIFLATGSGLKAYRHAHVQIGPMEDPGLLASDSAQSHARTDSLAVDKSLPTGILADSTVPGPPVMLSAAGALLSAPKVRDSSNFLHWDKDKGLGRGPDHPRSASAHKPVFTGKISLNHARAGELTAIRGIGEKTAQVIFQYRTEHGPFHDLRELLQIKGIGEKKLEKIIPFLIL